MVGRSFSKNKTAATTSHRLYPLDIKKDFSHDFCRKQAKGHDEMTVEELADAWNDHLNEV